MAYSPPVSVSARAPIGLRGDPPGMTEGRRGLSRLTSAGGDHAGSTYLPTTGRGGEAPSSKATTWRAAAGAATAIVTAAAARATHPLCPRIPEVLVVRTFAATMRVSS